MKRREVLSTLVPALVLSLTDSASGGLRCSAFDFRGIQQCEAGIDSSIARVRVSSRQYLTQWCWAASIEMVFRYYGFRISQARIVQETWGSIVNLPGYPQQILANLNRPWVDARGRGFGVSGDVLSANPMTAARDLADDMPLIIGTTGHAMVLTALRYDGDRFGNVNVRAAIVRDPWPGRGRRVLSAGEWYGTNFLARIRVFAL